MERTKKKKIVPGIEKSMFKGPEIKKKKKKKESSRNSKEIAIARAS